MIRFFTRCLHAVRRAGRGLLLPDLDEDSENPAGFAELWLQAGKYPEFIANPRAAACRIVRSA
ncbi:hypothetical protein [Zoogloea sp.]|uniref:hypothetical protein n=1 Tax=Zoogloea sp. TaxID=49181 RepID=UPI00261B4B7C|nr:hypothetical protein [uncultured Zoogloea sp.]